MINPHSKRISAEINIPGRKMDFGFNLAALPKYWYGNDAFKSTYMGALSCQFPEGERMFMDAVRDHQDKISDPRLLEQIKGFIKQEAMHGHEHSQFNKFLDTVGYPASKYEAFQKKERIWMRKVIPAKHMLAVTCALEHFTAIMAHQVLTNPEATEGMDEQFKELWKWHAIEETEHKAVAFDVYQEAVGSYWIRIFAMINITIMFTARTSFLQMIFLWKDGQLFKPSTWLSGFKFYFKKPGMVPSLWRDYIDYFRRDFHPWDHDNRELLDQWNEEHSNFKTI